jgi:hypothetical protein
MRPPVNHYRDEWRRAADGVYTACPRDNNGDEISFGVDPTLLGTAARPTRHAMTGTIDRPRPTPQGCTRPT